MRQSKQLRETMVAALALVLLVAIELCGQEPPNVALLFRQLQSAGTTDEAAQKLSTLGRSDVTVRRYLAGHLPAMIEKGPQRVSQPWFNAVRLAGDLKVADAAPALARWIALNTGGTVTFAEEARLEKNPAARSLVLIGEPAIPSVANALEHDNVAQRQTAVYVLDRMNSPKAKSVLRQHLKKETDPRLKKLIEKVLADT